MTSTQLVIIGGGPAGMSAAVAAYDAGIRDILILEREETLGGILKQCVHNGFGLHKFKEELTGPEYAYRYECMVKERNIKYLLETTVTNISKEKVVTAVSSKSGYFQIQAKAIILAMGCRERSKGAINIPGTRPAGLYSAGTAQKYVNIYGVIPGKRVVILGSGDIGLIMARRMTLEGAKVEAVCEILPVSGGLTRNIVQCLDDYNIPLLLSHTITQIHGKERVSGVTIARVDENKNPIAGTEMFIQCDTVLFSVGLVPENELTKGAEVSLDAATGGALTDQSRMTDVEGIFSCGNVLHVHDLVDFVSEEAETAGRGAAAYINGVKSGNINVDIVCGEGVRYTVPSKITSIDNVSVFFRVTQPCNDVAVVVTDGQNELYRKSKRRVAPGEMERVNLSADKLQAVSTGRIQVKIEYNREAQ